MNSNRTYYDNLNIVRVFLSLLVTWSHCYPLTGFDEPISMIVPTETGGAIAVKAFFFVSGLLVVKSWCRSQNSIEFILARSLRILPALFIALILTISLAFISSKADATLFLSAAFDYFIKNITLFSGVSYELPGAYSNQPTSSVNGSLWTLPWEVRAYLLLLVLGIIGVFRFKFIANIVLILLSISLFLPGASSFYDNKEVPFMLLAFIAGALVGINIQISQISKTSLFFFFAGVIFLFLNQPHFGIIFIIFSLVLFIGFTNHIPLIKMKNDPSFGIYVFSFPVQQFIVYIFGSINPLLLFTLTFVIVYPMGIFSWIFMEKKALNARIPLSAYFNRKHLNTIVNISLLLLFAANVQPIIRIFNSNPPVQKNETITQTDYLWGIYFPLEKNLSLRRDLSSGYADKQVKIENEGTLPLIGRWGNDVNVKLGIYDKQKCQFIFYSDLSTKHAIKISNLPCKSNNSQPLLGDWNGEGVLRPGIYFNDLGLAVLEKGENEYLEFYYGEPNSGLSAIAGDWNHDGLYSIAVWNNDAHRLDILNKNESSVADYSFTLERSIINPYLKPFPIKLPNGYFTFGLYDQDNGLIQIVSLEKKSVLQSIEYGEKMVQGYPVFLNY